MANNRRRLVGRVVSNKMDKTVIVAIERRKTHPIYKKVVKLTKKVMAHDESDAIEMGALVRVVESKPLSKNKRWVVEAVLREIGTPELVPLADEVMVTGGDAHADPVVEAVIADGTDIAEPTTTEMTEAAETAQEAVDADDAAEAVIADGTDVAEPTTTEMTEAAETAQEAVDADDAADASAQA